MPKPAGEGPPRRKFLFGPATWRQWAELAGLVVVVAGAVTLLAYSDELAGWQRVCGWSFLAVGCAYLLRTGIVRLFGPVLFYDVVRNARRSRTYVMRCGYLALLLFFLWSVVGSQIETHAHYDTQSHENLANPGEMAALAEYFFATFMGVQFSLAVFLTPAYVAGAVTDEKERKTLEYLLATDLDSREIVLGKLVARLGYLTLLLLTGLPVLSAVQFLGGVDPGLVFAGFAATALTVFSLAGISILTSVLTRRSRDAIVLTYLTVVLYCALCLLGSAVIELVGSPDVPLYFGLTVGDCVRPFQAGNPGYALANLFAGRSGPLNDALPGVMRPFAIFHVVVALATVSLAVVRLRPVALRETGGPGKGRLRERSTRSVSEPPMVWKEMHQDSDVGHRRTRTAVKGLLVLASFTPVAFIFFGPASSRWSSQRQIAEECNSFARSVGTIVACFGLLAVAVRGAVSVRSEKDKDTLDSLLTSPLTTREILFGKWVGCVWGMRWMGVWLCSIYLVGLLSGGVSPLAVPLLAGAILVYTGTLAVVGMWFSVVCKTTMRATVAAVFAALGLGVGHWLIWLCCLPFREGPGQSAEVFFKLQAGLTPPVVLAIAPFSNEETLGLRHTELGEFFTYFLMGTIAWAGMGFAFWALLNDRFQSTSNRADVIRPEDDRRVGSLELTRSDRGSIERE